jgi:hypothetical protein
MKNSKKLTPIIAAFMLVATTVPAYALDLGVTTNTDIKIEDGRSYKGPDGVKKLEDRNDDQKNDDRGEKSGMRGEWNDKSLSRRNDLFVNRIKSWIVNAGTVGEVTAVSTGSLSIKAANGEVYTVTTTDATVRRADDKKTTTTAPIAVGESVYVIGIKNANTIVASMIIVGETKDDAKPNAEEKRQSYFGAVTAKTDSSLTILSTNNVSYTVNLAAGAEIYINKIKQSNLSGFVVGDNVMVQGTISGNTISAKRLIAIHLPSGTIAGKITASSGTTLTVLGSDNKTYTVLTVDASVKAKDGSLAVGDSVVVKGDLAGTTLTAQTVTEGSVNKGFFQRFGLFFKNIFGKK